MNFEEIRRRNGVGVGAGSLSGSGSGSSFNGIREKYTTPTQGNTNTAGSGVLNTSGGTSKTSSFSSSTSDIISSNFDKMGSSKGIEGYNKYLADFAAAEDGDEEWWETLGRWLGGGIVDTTLPNAGVTQTIQDLRADNSYRLPRDDWSEKHKSEFGELYLTSPEAAFSYAEDINKTYNEYKEADDIYHIEKDATSSVGAGIGNTVGAILTAPLAAADFLGDLAYANAGREIGPDGNISPYEYSQAVTSGISTHLNKEGGTLPDDWAIIGGKGWGDVYGLGVSTTQSLLSAYTLGPAGTLVSYFGQGAAAGVDDAKARGASDEVAVLYGVTVGTFEAVAEKMGIDNLFKLDSASTLKGVIKNIIKQSGAEGAEEGVTALLTNIADNVWMNAVSPEGKSNFDLMVEELMAQGMSEGDAKNMAWWKSIEGIFYDTLSGSVSGGISGSVHTGVQNVVDSSNANKLYGDNAQDLVTEALEINPDNTYAQKLQEKLDSGKKLSGSELNRLALSNEEGKQGIAKAEALTKLEEMGESGDLELIGDAIANLAIKNPLTNAQKKALEASKYGKQVANEIVNGVTSSVEDAASGAAGAVKDAVSGVVNNVSSSVEGMLGLAENTFDEVTKNLWGGLSDLWGGLSGIGQNAQRAIENGVNAAKDAVGGAIDGAKDAAGNAVSATVDKVKSAVESELSALGEAGERASEIADVIAKKLRGIDLSEAEQRLFDTSDAAKQAFVNLGGEISEGANDATSKVGETVTSIKDKVKDTLDSLGEVRDVPKLTDIITKKLQGIELTDLEQKILDVSEHGKEAFESLKAEIGESVEGAKDKAESVVDGIKDAVSGVTDKATAENATDSEVSTESKNSASETTTETESSTESSTETTTETNTTTDTEVTVEQEGVATDTKVESIESITESGVNLKLQNDTIVNSNDVSFKNTDIGLIYQAVTDMTTRVGGFNIDTANTFVKGYTPDLGITAGEYIHGWSDAYRFGAKGFPASELVTGTFTSRLPAKLRNTAYNFGKAFGNDAIAKSITPSITKPTVSYQTITRRQGTVILPKGVSIETLTPMQRDSIKGLEVVSQALGKKIILFDDGNSNSNGSYNPNNGDIRINIRAGLDGRGVMLFTGSHELTHDLRVRNPQGFKRYADAVLDSYVKHFGKDGLTIEGLIRDKLDFLVRNDALEGLSEEEAYDLAYEEVIADSAESMLTDSKAFEEFSKRIQKEDKSLWNKIKKFFSDLVKKIKAAYEGYEPDSFEGKLLREMGEEAERLQKIWVDAILETADMEEASSEGSVKHSYSSISYSFFGDKEISIGDLENGSYKETEGYKKYVDMCLNNMRQTSEGRFDKDAALAEIEDSIDGIVRVAVAMKKAGYDILDNHAKRSAVDSKNRLLFSSLEPNSDYFTSSDISTICDKRINFSEIYDEIVRREEAMGVPANKRFFANVDNYFIIHDIMADKGLTQPCRECYVESMRKNLAPMANAFLELMQETDPDNKANKQLYQPSGKNKGELKSNNAKLRENLLKKIEDEKYDITVNNLTVEMLTTPKGLATLKLQAPFIYETFNSFYGQSKPKMPKEATPFRFGELTALLKDDNGKIRTGLIKQIMSTGGFRLQSYSDFQIQNFADVLQVIFEAGTLGLSGHAYTKVPAFLDATKGTNLKRNISIFMYNDGGEWKIDRNDSFPYALDEIYDIVKSDEQGNTSIIAVSQNEMMSSWIMANDNIGYFIPFHKSGMKMGTVRETVVKEDGREIKGYSGIKDHTRQQTEVWAKTTADHKALTKVNKGINIYDFWDFDNADNLSREGLIKKNVGRYIDACEKAGYLPKFREYVMNNSKVLNAVLDYSKQLGFVSQNATIDDISFKCKEYRIPYGYYKCLGDFGMFTPDGEASPIERLSLKEYNFDEAVAFFSKAETVKRNEILQQIANGEERERYRNSNMTTAKIAEEVQAKRNQVVDEVVSGEYKKTLEKVDVPIKNSYRNSESYSNRSLLANALEGVAQNDIERDKLQQYKEKIDLLNAEEQRLLDLRAKIKELSFAKGTRDTEAIKKLQLEATKAANRVNIYDKQLLNLESTKALKGVLEREKALARKKAVQRGKETLQRYRERAEQTQVRYKIKSFKQKLEKMLQRPTDRVYVPINLAKAMIDVCELIDTDTPLYKNDGSLNMAQVRRNATKDKLEALRNEYESLKTDDPIYKSEFDEEIYNYLKALRTDFEGRSLSDMPLADLEMMYEILKSIDETLRDARKVIGWGEASEVYAAGEKIIDEQAKISKSQKNGERTAAQKARDFGLDLSLAPVRNVERMSDYRADSPLLRLFKDFERGVRKKNKFVMDSHKMFEALTTGVNEKKYETAMYNEYGSTYTDVNGRKFKVSKMQMMQAVMSYEREVANNKHHIEGGGFTFADLDLLRKGKLKQAISDEHSHRINLGVVMAQKFASELAKDKWAQDYMAAARQFFDVVAKDAVNETYVTLKHRIIAREKNYIPFEVDKSFVVREISAENDIQQTISSYGMLKETNDYASQPLIITGLNNILERHIEQVGTVYGLAIPVRNFNKVWNVHGIDITQGADATVQGAIGKNWGDEGKKLITQTVQDIQSPRTKSQPWIYKKIKSNYIGSTFMLNNSVVFKQIGSLFSATSMLRFRDPVSMLSNLLYTMTAHKKIAAEIDKYTATAWIRRQGLSDAELATLATEAKKGVFAKLVRKIPTIINPTKKITWMDSMVAMSLWKYAKEDTAKRTGLKGEELLKATADFYDEVIENTQSMTDVLHRPEIQKRDDVLSEGFSMFKTDLFQSAGQLLTSYGRFTKNKSKENGAALARTVYSITLSAAWGSLLMNTLFALLRYKVNPYRDDEDDELTVESWLEKLFMGFFGDLAGYIFPIAGSEFVGMIDNIMHGESEDVVDSLVLTAINDLYSTMITIGSSISDGEMPKAEDFEKIVKKALTAFGVPVNNIDRVIDAIRLHAEDIANGEFLSFEAGLDKPNAQRLYNAYIEGDQDKIEKASRHYKDQSAINSAIRKALRENDPRIKEAAVARYNGDIAEYMRIAKSIIAEGHFKQDDVVAAINSEINAMKPDEGGSTSSDKAVSLYKIEDYYAALDESSFVANTVKEDMIAVEVVNGKDRDEAETSFYSKFVSHIRDMYDKGEINDYKAKDMLARYGDKTDAEAASKVQYWSFKKEYPDYDLSESAVSKYYSDVKPSGISIDVYYDYSKQRSKAEGVDLNGDGKTDSGSVKREVLQIINSLPISRYQKNVLYYLNGWSQSTISEAPWY